MRHTKAPVTKRTWLLCIAVAAFATAGNTQVFVSENFNSVTNPGLPAGWASSPASLWVSGVPNTVTPNALSQKGFSLNTPDHSKAVGIDGSQPSADNAVLSFPAISLPASATDAALTFDITYLGADNNGTWESISLEVSGDGGASWSHVAFIGQVNNPVNKIWETRSMPLGAYAGQSNLTFGIRYHNQGLAIIGAVLDNIKIVSGTDGLITTVLAGHPDPTTGIGYQQSGTVATLSGKVKNEGTTTITSYYIKYKIGNGAVQSSSLLTTSLAPLASENFPAGLSVNVPAIASYPVKAWIEIVGDVNPGNDTARTTLIGLSHMPVKRLVFEEGTGTWCGWCPRGNVFMDHFAQNHPNGDAAQIAVHNSDPMTVTAYDAYMSGYYSAFPSLLVDRKALKDPRSIDTSYTEAKDHFGFADFTIGAPAFNGSLVTLPISITPAITLSGSRLALVVTESNVTDPSWSQNNYYSGGGSGPMGGWENEASGVHNVYFHFVARSISPAPGGATGNLPSTLAAGTTYTTTLSSTLNNTWKLNDLQYIALLISGSDSSIMNSTFTALPTLNPTLGHTTGIQTIEENSEQAVVYPNPASDKSFLAVNMKQGGKAILTIADMTGRTVSKRSIQLYPGSNTIDLETESLAAGSYIVNLTDEKNYIHRKLQVAR